jgi:hypothetical protein
VNESLLNEKSPKINCNRLTTRLPIQNPSAMEVPVNSSKIPNAIATTIDI